MQSKPVLSWHMESCTLPRFEGGFAYPFAHSVTYQNGFTKVVRHTSELLQLLQGIVSRNAGKVLPVVMCTSLSAQMYCIAQLPYAFDVVAKGTTSPLAMTACDADGQPVMVFWDMENMFGKDYKTAANVACFELVGTCDLTAKRTPKTALEPFELDYLRSRARLPWACVRDLMKRNPLLDRGMLGRSVLTFTSVTRQNRKKALGHLKGLGRRRTVAQMWHLQNKNERPKSDDELYTYQACTRGGFAFVGSRHASVPYELTDGMSVCAYDAVSQYPAAMASHRFPERFKPETAQSLNLSAQIVLGVSLDRLLRRFEQPFLVAFDACFEFRNLRMKAGSVFEREGIALLQWARFNERMFEGAGDMQFLARSTNRLRMMGYKDNAIGAEHLFGKLTKAESCQVWLTELELWCMGQVYEWDGMEALCGYGTMSFCKPTDMTVLSVMHHYRAKQEAKAEGGTTYDNAKRALNSLYGIEATNEARPMQMFTKDGIELGELQGIEDLPSTSKAWYQMGQRVSGWGRVAQVCNILLAAPYVQGIISGDTDSLKFLVADNQIPALEAALRQWADALTLGKMAVCERVETQFPRHFDELEGIGCYVREYVTKRFCAAWNKAYVYEEGGALVVKLAGIRTATEQLFDEPDNSYTALANELCARHGFATVCNLLLGYNVAIDQAITKAQVYEYPPFGQTYQGEPLTVARHPLGVTLGNTYDTDTYADMEQARRNNPEVSTEEIMITWEPGQPAHIWSYTIGGINDQVL